MIEITLQNTENKTVSPAIKLHGKMDFKIDELAYIIFLLENGAYAKAFRNKLATNLPAEQMINIETLVSRWHTLTSLNTKKKIVEQKLEMAKVPVIKANQGIKIR